LASGKKENKSTDKTKKEFVAELIARMTVDEKIGQLNLPTSGDITTERSDVAEILEEGKVIWTI
jgi:beta-glucosidase